jgi:hypothetical protein
VQTILSLPRRLCRDIAERDDFEAVERVHVWIELGGRCNIQSRPARNAQFVSHLAAVDGELEERPVRDVRSSAPEAIEPRIRIEWPVNLDVGALNARERWTEIWPVGTADWKDLESKIEEAVPDLRVDSTSLQDLDEIDQSERNVDRQAAASVEQFA